MVKQGGNSGKVKKQILKRQKNHPLAFQKYNISRRDILKTF